MTGDRQGTRALNISGVTESNEYKPFKKKYLVVVVKERMKMSITPFFLVCGAGFFALGCCLVSLLVPSQKGQNLFNLL